ncbi:thaumatin family protein [Actinacidiphila alni]|uniref:thaumatin family protein n=1 Tax=Actinacidiphila alni TaxID=380248 RepID=UPI0034559EFF
MGRRGVRHGGRRRGGAWTAAVALAVAALCVAVYAVSGQRQGGSSSDASDAAARTAAAATGTVPSGAVPPSARPRPTRTPAVTPSREPGPPTSSTPTSTSTPTPTSRRTSPAAALPPKPGTRVFTFVNDVDRTIWLASGEQTPQPALGTTGWVLRPGQTLAVRVPDHWNGRFWGRTGCTFDAAGRGHCETGDCGGRFQCRGYGVIPATLAEFNLNAWSGLDFYDVSLVDGSNLPMYINLVGGTTKDPISANGCSAAGCTRAVDCPAALRVRAAGGRVVGCESPCGVFDTDQYCCRGKWAPRSMCLPDQWPVKYADVFKKAEPFAYSYVDDDATSTFTSKGEAGYRITFGVSG